MEIKVVHRFTGVGRWSETGRVSGDPYAEAHSIIA
jgi:hypothetical protein